MLPLLVLPLPLEAAPHERQAAARQAGVLHLHLAATLAPSQAVQAAWSHRVALLAPLLLVGAAVP